MTDDAPSLAVTIHFKSGRRRTIGGLNLEATDAILTWLADGKTKTANLTVDDGRRYVLVAAEIEFMEREAA